MSDPRKPDTSARDVAAADPRRGDWLVRPAPGDPRAVLHDLFHRAVELAAPATCLQGRLPPPPPGRTYVAAMGKAAASMARAVEDAWPADRPLEGLAVTRDGHGVACRRIEVVEAAHPVPDERSEGAATRMLEAAAALGPDDLLLCLVSGGGSALLVAPAPGITLDAKRVMNRALLRSGAPIGAMNTVRRHLSAIKGGALAVAAHPAPTITLAISDVPGDDPAAIASGPTVGDATTVADAQAVLTRYGLALPEGAQFRETPSPDDPRLVRARFEMVATPGSVLRALIEGIDRQAFAVVDLGAEVEGEAREVAETHALIASEVRRNATRPTLIVSGGETTVTVEPGTEPGRGGRNTEYLLALALACERDGLPVHAIAGDTDGIDGTEPDAGALLLPDSLQRARAAGLDPHDHLRRHDSHSLWAALGDLVTTGPTRTNVNDLRAILVHPEA